jgi:hypothetical protein
MATKEQLKSNFSSGQVITQSNMNSLIDSCFNDDVIPDAYEVVTTLPTTIPLGKLVLYNGTLWRGLLEGESSLAAGTAWPVKGYCEYVAIINQLGTDNPEVTIIKNELGYSFTWERLSVGGYNINLDNYNYVTIINKTVLDLDVDRLYQIKNQDEKFIQVTSFNWNPSLEDYSAAFQEDGVYSLQVHLLIYPPTT